MKNLFLSLFLASSLFLPLRSNQPSWILPFKSVQPLQVKNDDGLISPSCTAFSINREKGYWLTAGHCVHDLALAEELSVKFIFVDAEKDVAVFEGRHAPTIYLANGPGSPGDEVALIGYPFGSLDPVSFFGHIAGVRTRINALQIATAFNLLGLPGDSGGPILNRDGRVVGIGQFSSKAGLEWGTGWWELRSVLAAYWEN